MEAVIVEKDFWVCWTLKELFRLPAIGEHLIFKGGTSLSKVFKVIERFSEDIDVSIDRAFLGFGGANEPEAGGSNKEKQRRIEALKAACQQKIANELLPALGSGHQGERCARRRQWSLRSDDEDPDQQTLLFDYPTQLRAGCGRLCPADGEDRNGGAGGSLAVRGENGHAVCGGAVSAGIQGAELRGEGVVGGADVLGEGDDSARGVSSPGGQGDAGAISRGTTVISHELIRKGVGKSAAAKPELLARVAQHKSLFFKTSWAQYGEATKGSLRVAPPEHRVKALREDYAKMQQMFFGEPPEFDHIIALLRAVGIRVQPE